MNKKSKSDAYLTRTARALPPQLKAGLNVAQVCVTCLFLYRK